MSLQRFVDGNKFVPTVILVFILSMALIDNAEALTPCEQWNREGWSSQCNNPSWNWNKPEPYLPPPTPNEEHQVPEPGSLALLAVGLLAARRFRAGR